MSNWETLLTSWVRQEESNRTQLKDIVALLLIEFPNELKYMENEPRIHARIREGLSDIEKAAMIAELPNRKRNIEESSDIKEIRKIKKRVQSKLQYYSMHLKEAMFPSKKKRIFEERMLNIAKLEREIREVKEQVEADEESCEKQSKKSKSINYDKEGVQHLINVYDQYMPTAGCNEEYFKRAWMNNIPLMDGVFQFDNCITLGPAVCTSYGMIFFLSCY